MSTGTIIFLGLMAVLFMITLVIVVAVWRGTSPDLISGKAGRKQNESFIKMLNDIRDRQRKMGEDLTELRERTMNIEKILREVE